MMSKKDQCLCDNLHFHTIPFLLSHIFFQANYMQCYVGQIKFFHQIKCKYSCIDPETSSYSNHLVQWRKQKLLSKFAGNIYLLHFLSKSTSQPCRSMGQRNRCWQEAKPIANSQFVFLQWMAYQKSYQLILSRIIWSLQALQLFLPLT